MAHVLDIIRDRLKIKKVPMPFGGISCPNGYTSDVTNIVYKQDITSIIKEQASTDQNIIEQAVLEEVINNTSIAQSVECSFEFSITENEEWNNSNTVSIDNELSIELSSPIWGGAKASVKKTESKTWGHAKGIQKTRTWNRELTVIAPPFSKINCGMIVQELRFKIPYSFKIILDGRIYTPSDSTWQKTWTYLGWMNKYLTEDERTIEIEGMYSGNVGKKANTIFDTIV